MKRKITDTAARTLRCPVYKRETFVRDTKVRDTELRGLGMRVSRNVTSFIYESGAGGKSKRVTIGQWPAWSADEARAAAGDAMWSASSCPRSARPPCPASPARAAIEMLGIEQVRPHLFFTL